MKREIDFGNDPVTGIIFHLAPPVMLAQLIQALYNIVDSLFVGRYDERGLTALSIIYPVQLLMIALAVGTGVGVNTVMAAKMGMGKSKEAQEYAGVGTPFILGVWAIFALVFWFFLPTYAGWNTDSPEIAKQVTLYGRIVCVGGIGLFLEGIWTKILQAEGDVKTPMTAQIAGALANVILDPLLIFGVGNLHGFGIGGAAVATILGQFVAAAIVFKKGYRKASSATFFLHHVKKILALGIPNMLMQSAYTFYIMGLNLILSDFSDQAVTALGLYYKWQTFFFIPLGSMQTCIVPILSYNYAARKIRRCRNTLFSSIGFGLALMFLGTLCFELIPAQMLRVFSKDPLVIEIGSLGFHFIGISFLPMVTSLIFPVYFQAVGAGVRSCLLTILRTMVLFVPLGYVFSRHGLSLFWLTFPITETITTLVGIIFYVTFMRHPYHDEGNLTKL